MSQTQNKLTMLWNILRFTFGLVPVIAGLDKFTNLLVQWDTYLSPAIQSLLPFAPHTFLMIVGIIEIAAGIIVLRYTKIGSYIVMAWLIAIAVALVAGGMFDVAVRDLVMAIGAYTLSQLTDLKEQTV
jgi:uncharacterized membrane protein YphA (DoxX/SURF4 family)